MKSRIILAALALSIAPQIASAQARPSSSSSWLDLLLNKERVPPPSTPALKFEPMISKLPANLDGSAGAWWMTQNWGSDGPSRAGRNSASAPASLPISLPAGVTLANATPQQLADAVSAAIKANPAHAQAIATSVSRAIAALPNAKALATALATAIASSLPADQVPTVVAAAAHAAADAGAPSLAVTLAVAAAAVVPEQTEVIKIAVSNAVPQEADNIAKALSPGAGSTTIVGAPGRNTQSTIQNPANLNAGRTNSPTN